MADKVRRITQREIENSPNIDKENILHVKHGKKWIEEPAVIISEQYLEERKGIDENQKLQLLAAKSLIKNDFPGLTKRQKEVILLYLQGNTQQEISKLLKISRNTVKSYIKRSKSKIKKLIPEFQKEEL